MTDSGFLPDTKPSKPASNIAEYTVTEISGALKRTVEDRFGMVRVRGEITGYRGPHSSGHSYFALKDDRARIEAVIWRGAASKLKHLPEEGLEVIASGKLTTYPGSSKYQIVIDNLEPAGAGALMALLEERKKKLTAEGLFAPERKQILPYMPKVIGVVTSPTGAVIRDVLHRLSDRFPLHVIVWPVRVQGDTCGNEVANAVNQFNALPEDGKIARPDLLIVARGGGSIEDLWGFNDEVAVRAVADSNIPVISAVGHETDWTLIDLAADVRAPTPTGAAEIAVPVKSELNATVTALASRLQTSSSRNIDGKRTGLLAASRGLPTPDSLLAMPRRHIDELSGRLFRGLISMTQVKSSQLQRVVGKGIATPQQLFEISKLKLADLSRRLSQGTSASHQFNRARLLPVSKRLNPVLLENVTTRSKQNLAALDQRKLSVQRHQISQWNHRLSQATRLIGSLSHTRVLERGYTYIADDKGKPVMSAKSMSPGMPFSVEFKDGSVSAIAAGTGSKPVKRHKRTSQSGSHNQGDLF